MSLAQLAFPQNLEFSFLRDHSRRVGRITVGEEYGYTILGRVSNDLVCTMECGNNFPRKVREFYYTFEDEEIVVRDREDVQLFRRGSDSLNEQAIDFCYEPPLTSKIREFLRVVVSNETLNLELKRALDTNRKLLEYDHESTYNER